jgi:hypothetical protein
MQEQGAKIQLVDLLLSIDQNMAEQQASKEHNKLLLRLAVVYIGHTSIKQEQGLGQRHCFKLLSDCRMEQLALGKSSSTALAQALFTHSTLAYSTP